MLEKLLNDIRNDLRINHNELDSEIKDLIDTSIDDLKSSGIASSYFNEDKLRPMLKMAVVTFCKAHFGFDNSDSLKYQETYELIKQKLAIAYHDYVELVETEE